MSSYNGSIGLTFYIDDIVVSADHQRKSIYITIIEQQVVRIRMSDNRSLTDRTVQ